MMDTANGTTDKNGTIELLRFFFMLCIVGVHLNGVTDLGLFKFGHYGVEFFFLISGLFMAQSIERHIETMGADPCRSAFHIVLKKVKRIFPYVILVTVATIVLYALPYRGFGSLDAIMDTLNLIPYMFFTQMTGMGSPTPMYLNVIWFLSALFISILILAPVYIRYNSLSKHILFPVVGLFSLGYLILTCDTITLSTEAPWGLHLGMLRAIGEVAIGAVCYNIAIFLRERYDLTVLGRIMVLLIIAVCLTAVIVYINGDILNDSPSAVFFLLAIIVTLVYSGVTWNIGCGRIVSFLGNISLPMYLSHTVVILAVSQWCGTDWFTGKELLTFAMIFSFTVVLYIIAEYAIPRLKPARKLFIKADDTDKGQSDR